MVGVFTVAGRSLRRKLRYRFARARARARARDLTDSVDSDERWLDSIDCRLARPRKSLEFTWGSSNCIQTYQLRRVPSDSTLLCQREANSGGLLRRPSPECTGPAPLRGGHPAADYIFMFPEGRASSRFDAPHGREGGAGGEGGISQQLPRVGENYLCLGVRGGEVYNHGRGQLDSSTFIFL